MRFNHAGDRLLSTDWSGNGHLWDTRSGRLLLTLPTISGVPPYFSPDDRMVATGGRGKVQLFYFRRGEELRRMVHGSTRGQSTFRTDMPPRLDSEGRLLAIWVRDEGIALVDVERGEEVALLPLPDNLPLRFEIDGSLWTCGPNGLLPLAGHRRFQTRTASLWTAPTHLRVGDGLSSR